MENAKIGSRPLDAGSNLQIIEEMLQQAKAQMTDNGFYYMLWGWLVFVAALGQYIGDAMHLSYAGLVWPILMPLGAVASIIASKRENAARTSKTWFDNVMFYLWTGYGVVLGLTLFYMGFKQINLIPVVLSIYGLGLFTSGGILKFRPLIIGGMVNWALSVACWFIPDQYHMLVLALALLLGYIIPGHMLNMNYKK